MRFEGIKRRPLQKEEEKEGHGRPQKQQRKCHTKYHPWAVNIWLWAFARWLTQSVIDVVVDVVCRPRPPAIIHQRTNAGEVLWPTARTNCIWNFFFHFQFTYRILLDTYFMDTKYDKDLSNRWYWKGNETNIKQDDIIFYSSVKWLIKYNGSTRS